MKNEEPIKPFICQICGLKCKSFRGYRRHMLATHGAPRLSIPELNAIKSSFLNEIKNDNISNVVETPIERLVTALTDNVTNISICEYCGTIWITNEKFSYCPKEGCKLNQLADKYTTIVKLTVE